jgi:alcohol dehydrogenase (cytochrome c)
VVARFARCAAVLLAIGAPLRGQLADWPSYNRTLTSERFTPVREIDRSNVARLTVLCRYEVGPQRSFQTGLIEVKGELVGTTETDIFALDANTCAEKWRVHESDASAPGDPLRVNRGAAYADGRLFRGTQDGRVLAYDAATGKRLWAARIADPKKRETVPAAPIAWDGMVFVGNSGGDYKGVKGRVYALDEATGKILWETYLVPKTASDPTRGRSAPQPEAIAKSWGNAPDVPITGGGNWTSYTLDPATGILYVPGGQPAPDFAPQLRPGENLLTGTVAALDARTGAYRAHYRMIDLNSHDYDVAAAPAVVTTRGGRRVLIAAPKDGHLYAFDLATGQGLYKTPVTRIENADVIPSREGTHFCPGTQGGAEWNGPAFDPERNLVFTGEVDWCTTVRVEPPAKIVKRKAGKFWTGAAYANPKHTFGVFDPKESWSGRLTATDADSGEVRWRFRAPHPLLSGVTPTAAGLVFFGDIGGNLYALDSRDGTRVWAENVGGPIGGGVIAYVTPGGQRVAAAVGTISPLWPTGRA